MVRNHERRIGDDGTKWVMESHSPVLASTRFLLWKVILAISKACKQRFNLLQTIIKLNWLNINAAYNSKILVITWLNNKIKKDPKPVVQIILLGVIFNYIFPLNMQYSDHKNNRININTGSNLTIMLVKSNNKPNMILATRIKIRVIKWLITHFPRFLELLHHE